MKPLVLIPARMESTRFPGKPLAHISGTAMIDMVYQRVVENPQISGCAVCTNSIEIIEYCEFNNLNYIKTSNHLTGTDRVLEAALSLDADLIINVQGDEPMLHPDFLSEFAIQLVERAASPDSTGNVLLAAYCSATAEESLDKNVVKCLISSDSHAVAFSRLPLCSLILDGVKCFYKQIGVYGYTMKSLQRFGRLGKSALEDSERVELMRWIDHVGRVPMIRSDYPAYSVDTIEDLIKVERLLSHNAFGKLS